MHLILFLSDNHIGFESESYSVGTAIHRLLQIPDKLRVTEQPKTCTLAFAGDITHGSDITPHQNAMISMSARQQVTEAHKCYVDLIRQLKRKWRKCVFILQCAYGNHGRTSKTAHPDNNWDLALHDRLAITFKEDPRVNVVMNYKPLCKFTVGGKRFIMIHKTKAREIHMETPSPMARILRRLRRHNADIFLNAHYHSAIVNELDGVLCSVQNGSLCGPDEFYCEELGVYTPAKQAVISVYENETLTQDNVSWLRW